MFERVNLGYLSEFYGYLMLAAIVAQWIVVPVGAALYVYIITRRARW
ncbi:MAG: hypothetical protein KGZ93_03330 [Actinobacteria bacterium]|nr:hypothetical protein [Actinomycetota bacterium]